MTWIIKPSAIGIGLNGISQLNILVIIRFRGSTNNKNWSIIGSKVRLHAFMELRVMVFEFVISHKMRVNTIISNVVISAVKLNKRSVKSKVYPHFRIVKRNLIFLPQMLR